MEDGQAGVIREAGEADGDALVGAGQNMGRGMHSTPSLLMPLHLKLNKGSILKRVGQKDGNERHWCGGVAAVKPIQCICRGA